jgi:hypothetical protein
MAAKYIIFSLGSSIPAITAAGEPITLFGRFDAKLELQYGNNDG